MADELHIASLVVHSAPADLTRVSSAIGALPGALVHGSHPSGKLVVTLEAANAGLIVEQLSAIQGMDGVLNASLVYQHAEAAEALNEGVHP